MATFISDDVRKVLKCRSERDKIAVPRHQAVAPVELLPIVSMLVRYGFMTWLDRATLPFAIIHKETNEVHQVGVSCDIYLLTPKGVALCDEHGIPQQ